MMKIGNRFFDVEHDCSIMGILNVTPDSFSDGGRWNKLDEARRPPAENQEGIRCPRFHRQLQKPGGGGGDQGGR